MQLRQVLFLHKQFFAHLAAIAKSCLFYIPPLQLLVNSVQLVHITQITVQLKSVTVSIVLKVINALLLAYLHRYLL